MKKITTFLPFLSCYLLTIEANKNNSRVKNSSVKYKTNKPLLLMTLLVVVFLFNNVNVFGQQNVFSRSDANTGDWGSGNLPWYYQSSNNNQGDPDNGTTTRNDVFIGHNNSLVMSLNGRYYIHRDFTFQAGASSQRTLNNTVGGGFSFSRALVNASTAAHIFNAPVAIDLNNAEIRLDNSAGGSLTFNGSIFTNNFQTFVRFNNSNTGVITFNGTMGQGGSFVKQGLGTLLFTGSADFSGTLFVDEGTLRIARNLSSNTIEIGGGVQLSTGFNATLDINSNVTVSKNILVKNFGTGSGNRFINFTHSSSTATLSGTLVLEKAVTINNNNVATGATISGVISGSGGLTKTGAGTLTLTAANGNNTANTYSGATIISAADSGTINVTGLTNITSTAITRDTQSVTFSTPTPTNGTYKLLSSALTVNTQSFSHNANATKAVTFNYSNSTVTVSNPSITTSAISPTAYCAGTTVSVAYSSSGTYSGTFTAQLSNASGSFTSPTAIGSGSSPITATIPLGTTPGSGYKIRVVNNNPIVNGTDNGVAITINAIPSTPTITGSTTFCQGGSTELSSSAVAGNQWYKDGVLISGATSNLLSVSSAGSYTVIVTVSGCSSTPSTGITVSTGIETIWNGTSWSTGNPDSTKPVRFEANATIGEDFYACSLTVANNAVVSVSSGVDVTINGAITVSSGSFTLENNASLVQNTTENNSGNIIVKRNSSSLMRQDYTLWSSPVASQNLFGFSPQTLTTRFYTYDQASDIYTLNDMYQGGTPAALSATSTFQSGRGYLIRMPNTHPTTPTTWEGQFTGVPNNGNISVALTTSGGGYTLVGNPYPSPINVDAFLNQNLSLISPTLWFWRKTNGVAGSAYVALVADLNSGGNSVLGEASETNDRYIQQGQGFFVQATAAGNLQFNNQQRLGIVDTFYRTNDITTSTVPAIGRLWLHLKSNDVVVGSMAIGYREGATNELDTDYDGLYINDKPLALTSFVQGEELSVQHRAVPFTSTDSVPLSFKTDVAGTFAIAINDFDGLFSNGQSIYLRDNLIGSVHDLNAAPYSFTTNEGIFTSRFEVVYQGSLNTNNPILTNNQVIIYKNEVNNFTVNSGNLIMDSVKVFDIRGRLLQEYKAINASQTNISLGLSNEVLLVQITSNDGVVVTKKVVR